MKNSLQRLQYHIVVIALCAGFTTAVSGVAFAHDDSDHAEMHGRGQWNSAAAQVCKSQTDDADKKACFKQLAQQRKAAMQAFESSFAYTPTTPVTAPSASAGTMGQ